MNIKKIITENYMIKNTLSSKLLLTTFNLQDLEILNDKYIRVIINNTI